jgi:hypothetical protein
MSPIKGLSEQRRLPRIGKIRLGVKKPNASGKGEHPSAVDYFVLPDDSKDLFPEEPRELPIMFPTEDDEVICQQYYKRYSSTRGLTCRGDGDTCRRMIDAGTGYFADRDTKEVVWKERLTCEGRQCPEYTCKPQNCKEVMNLQFIMPDIPGLGIWQIDTSSINSIRNINNAIAMTRAVYKRIAYIPLVLTIEPTEVVNPDDGKKKKVYVLNLRTRGTMKELMVSANRPVSELLLPCPSDDEAPMDLIEEQFAPEIEHPDTIKNEATKPVEVVQVAKPVEAVKPKKEPAPKITKSDVDNAVPITDADFDVKENTLVEPTKDESPVIRDQLAELERLLKEASFTSKELHEVTIKLGWKIANWTDLKVWQLEELEKTLLLVIGKKSS